MEEICKRRGEVYLSYPHAPSMQSAYPLVLNGPTRALLPLLPAIYLGIPFQHVRDQPTGRMLSVL